jgi:hypothetical protein
VLLANRFNPLKPAQAFLCPTQAVLKLTNSQQTYELLRAAVSVSVEQARSRGRIRYAHIWLDNTIAPDYTLNKYYQKVALSWRISLLQHNNAGKKTFQNIRERFIFSCFHVKCLGRRGKEEKSKNILNSD